MKPNKMLLGLLAGLAIGAALGVALAPAKGTTTLRRITRKGEELFDDAKEGFDDLISGISDQFAEEEEAPARRTQTRKTTARTTSR